MTAYTIDKLNIYKNTLIIYFEVNNVLGGLRGVNRLLVFGYYIAIAYGIAKSVPNTQSSPIEFQLLKEYK